MNHFFVYNRLLKIPVEQESQSLRAAVLLGRAGISLSDSYTNFVCTIKEKEKASRQEKLKMMIEDYLVAGDTEMVNMLVDLKKGMMLNKAKIPVQGHRGLDFITRPLLEAGFKEYIRFLIENFNKSGLVEVTEGLRKYDDVFRGFGIHPQKGEETTAPYNTVSESLMEAAYEDTPCFHILQDTFLQQKLDIEIHMDPCFLLPDLVPLKAEEFPLIRKQTQSLREAFLLALAGGEGVSEAAQAFNQALRNCQALRPYYLDQLQFFQQLSLGWVAPTVIWDFLHDQGMIHDDSWEVMQVKRGLTPEKWSTPVPFLVIKELEGSGI